MKKKVVVFLAGLLTVLSMGFGSAQFSDVPAGHWAKEAVEQLAAKGILVGFPDGTFRGTETLTRYQAALILQRLLEEIDMELKLIREKMGQPMSSGSSTTTTTTTTTPPAMGSSEVDQRLQAQIDTVRSQIAALEATSASNKQDIEALRGQLARLTAMQSGTSTTTVVTSDPELMNAVRNAVQELAAELAALGVRVSALEDNAASKDELGALQATLSELNAKIAAIEAKPAPEMDMSALQDLADRVEAASVAADTALAQTQQLSESLDASLAQVNALSGRIDAVEGDIATTKTQLEADADSIRALNELAVLLNQDVLTLQDRITAAEKALGDAATKAELQAAVAAINTALEDYATKEDVAAVQEFTIALRGDLVKLADRVAGLETGLSGLTSRVATLERNGFTISGSLSLNYRVNRGWSLTGGAPEAFDIDRLFPSNVSSGDGNQNGQVVDEADLGTNAEGRTGASLAVTFKARNFTASSQPGNLNSYPDLVSFSIRGSWADGQVANNTADGDMNTLFVDAVSTTLNVAANQQLSFAFGRSVRSKFTEYVFDNDATSRGHGFVATFRPGVLGAVVTGVYGSRGADNADFDYFRGARVAADLGIAKVGASFVQEGDDVNQGGNVPVAGALTTVFGVDASTTLGPVGLSAEYFSSDKAADSNGFYVRASANLGFVNLGANYRSIGAGVTGANMISGDTTDYNAGSGNNAAPFRAGQTGFGITASTTLGPIGLNGFFNSYVAGANNNAAFGITASATLGPVALTAFFNSATSNGAAANTIADERPGSGVYNSNLGVRATIDGLLPNIILNASFENRPVLPSTDITARVDFAAKNSSGGLVPVNLGFANLQALARFNTVDAATDSTTLKFALRADTGALASLPLAPTVLADFGYRSTTAAAVTTETKWSVGVRLAQFLFANSTLEARYGSYAATNVASVLLGSSDAMMNSGSNNLFNGAGAANGGVDGLFFTWTYWDLVFSYADVIATNGAAKTNGQTFRISYRVTF